VMVAEAPKPVRYPKGPLPGPSGARTTKFYADWSVRESLVIVGIIVVLLAIMVPVVRKVREEAMKAAEMQTTPTTPSTSAER